MVSLVMVMFDELVDELAYSLTAALNVLQWPCYYLDFETV